MTFGASIFLSSAWTRIFGLRREVGQKDAGASKSLLAAFLRWAGNPKKPRTPPMPGHLDVVEGLKPIRACSLLRACAGGDQEPGDSALRAEYQPAQGVHAPPQLFSPPKGSLGAY